MRVCQGVINEVQYQKIEKMKEKGSEGFICMKDTKFNEGDLTFMHDNIGYHKVSDKIVLLCFMLHDNIYYYHYIFDFTDTDLSLFSV